jgi:hypothetical protein
MTANVAFLSGLLETGILKREQKLISLDNRETIQHETIPSSPPRSRLAHEHCRKLFLARLDHMSSR